MKAQFNVKKQDELRGFDVRIIAEDDVLQAISSYRGFGLIPFGYEKEWFYIPFDKACSKDSEEINVEKIVNEMIILFEHVYGVKAVFSPDTVDVSEVPKIDVYYVLRAEDLEQEGVDLTDLNAERMKELDEEYGEVELFMAISTKHDYEVEETFEIYVNERISNYYYYLFNIGLAYECHLEILNEIDLTNALKENPYFTLIHNKDLIW